MTFTAIWALLKASRPAQLGLIILAVAIAAFTVAKCTGGNDGEARQAEQTTRSSEAIADAAQDAIAKLGNQTATAQTINAAIASIQGDIHDAPTVAAIHARVAAELCKDPRHSRDSACTMR